MKWFFKLISIVFHPILMSFLGAAAFFMFSPIYYTPQLIKAASISIGILTIAVPLLIALALKKIGYINSYHINNVRQRIIPLCINLVITGAILFKLLPKINSVELYYFYIGVLGSTIACLVMAICNVKASIHMIGITGLLTFILGLSFHYAINLTPVLAVLIIITGLVASSRLYLKAHTNAELLIGILLGIMPQLITFQYWL